MKASDASSNTAVAAQPTMRRWTESENSFTMAVFADRIISITIRGTATIPLITADQDSARWPGLFVSFSPTVSHPPITRSANAPRVMRRS
jgi:hypothetical protein